MKIRHIHSLAKKRALRVRSKMSGSAHKPRISVYRSNKHTYVQAINDEQGATLAAVHSKSVKGKSKKTKTEVSKLIGETLAKALKTKKITQAVFDRGSYRFHGRVKAVAEGLREQGVQV